METNAQAPGPLAGARLTGTSINLEPSPDQYENIARRFIDSQAYDLSTAHGSDSNRRRASALAVLSGLIELAGYLATLPDGPARIARLKAYAEAA